MADTTSPGLGNLDPDQAGSNQTTQNQPGLLKSERNGLRTQPTRHRNPGGGFWPLIPARMSLTRIVAPMFRLYDIGLCPAGAYGRFLLHDPHDRRRSLLPSSCVAFKIVDH